MKKLSDVYMTTSEITMIESLEKRIKNDTLTPANVNISGDLVNVLIDVIYKLNGTIERKNNAIINFERKHLEEYTVKPEIAISEININTLPTGINDNGLLTMLLGECEVGDEKQIVDFLENKIREQIGEVITANNNGITSQTELYSKMGEARYNSISDYFNWGRLENYKLVTIDNQIKIYGLIAPWRICTNYSDDEELIGTLVPKLRTSCLVIDGQILSTSIIAIDLVHK